MNSGLHTKRPIAGRICHRGFTLIEALVALIIFGVISVALSMAFSVALRSHKQAQAYQLQSGTVRVILDRLTRDIEAAYGSPNDPSSVFVAGSGSGNGTLATSGQAGMLTLSTLVQRIQTGMVTGTGTSSTTQSSPTSGTSASSSVQTPPQSDCDLIRYNLDTVSGTLSRTVINVPSLQALTSTQNSDVSTVLSQDVISLTLQFWDPTQQVWRQDWDYEQQTQASSTSTGSGSSSSATGSGSSATGSGGASASGQASSTSSTTSTTQGDAQLPTMVQVTLTIRGVGGQPATYSTNIPITAQMPLDANTPATTSTSSVASTGSGGNSAGGGSSGGQATGN